MVVGSAYGVFMGGLLFLIDVLAGGPPVDLMLDYSAIVRSLILLATIICGSAGAVVGLLVTLLGADKIKARAIGFCFGWLILAAIVFTIWPELKNELSGKGSWVLLFLIFLLLFIVFPIGLAATAVLAVRVSDRFASR